MTTTIQISEETKQKLLEVIAELQIKEGRRITYEEAIQYLINRESSNFKARQQFKEKYHQTMSSEAYTILREERKRELEQDQ